MKATHRISVRLWLMLLLLAIPAAGCAGSGSSASSPEPGKEASAQFRHGAKSKKIANFGKEASANVRAEAEGVLEDNLAARESADFKAQCESLSKNGLKVVFAPVTPKDAAKECPETLGGLAKPLKGSEKVRADPLKDGSVSALRVSGARAYALFHGNDGKDYAMPMETEKGQWKVAAIVPVDIS